MRWAAKQKVGPDLCARPATQAQHMGVEELPGESPRKSKRLLGNALLLLPRRVAVVHILLIGKNHNL